MIKTPLFVAAGLMLSASVTLAQNVIGTTVVDGREVVLYQDKTWAFKQQASENCEEINKFLRFCGDDFLWRKNPPPTDAIAAQYTPDPKLYLQYLPEGVGSKDGITYETFRKVAIQYASQASGITPDRVPILLSEDKVVSGHSGTTLAYHVDFSGTDVVFANTMIIGTDWSIQIQTYEIGVNQMTEKHTKHHAESLKLTRLGAS